MKSTSTAARIVADCHPAMQRYAMKLARSNPEDADDLMQAAIERALSIDWDAETIREPEAYLIRVLRNLHVDSIRQGRREGTTDDAILDTISVPGNQDIALLCGETLQAINTLPPHTRVLMRMAAEGASYREIADALGVPVGTVTSRLARARADLAKRVGWSPELAA